MSKMSDAAKKYAEKWETTHRSEVTKSRSGNYDRFQPDVGTLYTRMAILQEPSWEVPSQRGWAPSVAVNLVKLDSGERLVWWFTAKAPDGQNSIFRDRLEFMLNKAKSENAHYPMEIRFVIRENISKKTGNTYKELLPEIVCWGDDVNGDLGLDAHLNPKNDASVPSQDGGNRASTEQWESLKTLFGQNLGEHSSKDVVKWCKDHGIKVKIDEIQGKPPAGGLPRIGHGSLSTDKAAELINAMTLALTEEE